MPNKEDRKCKNCGFLESEHIQNKSGCNRKEVNAGFVAETIEEVSLPNKEFNKKWEEILMEYDAQNLILTIEKVKKIIHSRQNQLLQELEKKLEELPRPGTVYRVDVVEGNNFAEGYKHARREAIEILNFYKIKDEKVDK